MNIKIRSEQISDYNNIANINYEAFLGWQPDNPFVSESILVDMLRHNAMFDPELSLVAELDGKIVGHVLFSPYKFIVLGVEELGVVLGPVAVRPEYQYKSVGKMLIEAGHKKAKEKGVAFSLLCGHEEYYPRFGYKTGMFSLSGAKVNISREFFNNEGFSDRPVASQDIPWILEAWKRQHGTDTLALFPGDNISEWSNHGFACCCAVVKKNDRILGYVRYVRSSPLNIRELLAKSEDIPEILAYLAWKKYGKAQGEISIALPAEKVMSVLDNANDFEIFDDNLTHKAFMIKDLAQESLILKYCTQVEKGSLRPGIIVFPPMFDVEDGRSE